MIKSLAELNALKEEMKEKISMKNEGDGIRIVVGLATCGIAAGAAPILTALENEVKEQQLASVSVKQVGCVGLCEYEPIVEIIEGGKEKVTYVKMDAQKAKEVIHSHIINGKIIKEYTIGAVTANSQNKN